MAANDPKDIIIPVARFLANTTLPTPNPEKPAGYTIDFGSFEKGVLKISGDLKKIKAALNGRLGLNKLIRTGVELTYEFDLQHLSPSMLVYWMGSASGSAPNPGAVVDLYGFAAIESDAEPLVPTGNTNEGSGIFTHYGFKFGLTLDGDFNADGSTPALLKLTASVYLGNTPGLWAAGTRPITPAGA